MAVFHNRSKEGYFSPGLLRDGLDILRGLIWKTVYITTASKQVRGMLNYMQCTMVNVPDENIPEMTSIFNSLAKHVISKAVSIL